MWASMVNTGSHTLHDFFELIRSSTGFGARDRLTRLRPEAALARTLVLGAVCS